MFDNRLIEFILEFLRALLIDGLSGHVRRGIVRLVAPRRTDDYRKVVAGIHRRNRKRLMHRLLTEEGEEP
jgi:hypothetical protein